MAGRFVSLLLSIALFSSSIGAQQAEQPVLDQLATDYYANKYRVASDEARRRLRIQERASGIEDRIATRR